MAIGMTAISVFRAVTEFGLLPALVQRSSLDKEHYDAAWSAGLLRGFAVGFEDTATYWLDDMVAWNVDDIDPATGLCPYCTKKAAAK